MKKYLAAVIGSPISQSRSPEIHNQAYRSLGIDFDWDYSKREVNFETLDSFIKEVLESQNHTVEIWRGFSVTMPLKQAVIKHLDFVDPIALESSAVNTVIVNNFETSNPKLFGYNTDIYGIVEAVKEFEKTKHLAIRNDRLLILGNGATSRSAIQAGKLFGFQSIQIAARSKEFDIRIDSESELKSAVEASDLIISTLNWNGAKEILPKLAELKLPPVLECAFPKVLSSSIKGERMLLHQAVKQIELMTNCKISADDIKF